LGISRPRRACWQEADSSLTSEAQLSLSKTDRQTDRNRVFQFGFLQKTPQPRNFFVQFFHPSRSNQFCCGFSLASKYHTLHVVIRNVESSIRRCISLGMSNPQARLMRFVKSDRQIFCCEICETQQLDESLSDREGTLRLSIQHFPSAQRQPETGKM